MRSTSTESTREQAFFSPAVASLASATQAPEPTTQHFEVCEDCDGRGTLGYGYAAYPPIDCPTCHGAGLMEVWR